MNPHWFPLPEATQAPLPISVIVGWDPCVGLRPLTSSGMEFHSHDIYLVSQLLLHLRAGAFPLHVSTPLTRPYVAPSVFLSARFQLISQVDYLVMQL